MFVAVWNVPSPLPSEIETLSELARVTAASRFPLFVKYPTAIADGPEAGSTSAPVAEGGSNVPSPVPM